MTSSVYSPELWHLSVVKSLGDLASAGCCSTRDKRVHEISDVMFPKEVTIKISDRMPGANKTQNNEI